MSKHTPTPWELFDCNGVVAIRNPRARSSKSEIVFWSGFDASHYPKKARANAAFIVQAVNNHDFLIKVLEKIAGHREYDEADHKAAAKYKREDGFWTTDEYLADSALTLAGSPGKP